MFIRHISREQGRLRIFCPNEQITFLHKILFSGTILGRKMFQNIWILPPSCPAKHMGVLVIGFVITINLILSPQHLNNHYFLVGFGDESTTVRPMKPVAGFPPPTQMVLKKHSQLSDEYRVFSLLSLPG